MKKIVALTVRKTPVVVQNVPTVIVWMKTALHVVRETVFCLMRNGGEPTDVIKESLLSLSLSVGGDLFTSEVGRDRGFLDRNPLCSTTTKCVAYSAAWTAIGTFTTHKMERRYGRKVGWITLGLFCAVPLGAAIHNGVKLW